MQTERLNIIKAKVLNEWTRQFNRN